LTNRERSRKLAGVRSRSSFLALALGALLCGGGGACKRTSPWPPTSGRIEVSKGKVAGVLRFERGRIVEASYEQNAGGAELRTVVGELQGRDLLEVTTHDPEARALLGIKARPGDARYMQAVYVMVGERGFGAKLDIP
jgi:hypothetical protein